MRQREALEYERQKKLNNSRSMDMKLSEFMEVYFEDKQNELKERTMKNKRYMMEQHIVPYFGNQMMSEITAGQIIQWQNRNADKGIFRSIFENDTKLINQLIYSCIKDLQLARKSL
ncbi:N-terminal phage integrase SAM-like domain-containing protein [Eubacterium ramulus]|uniref:N-terminal phage integrase SAM-like domain-containing protein n=1 Tax=Eubacterium ramulus TaxID=39490 RepID=UPI00399ABEE2